MGLQVGLADTDPDIGTDSDTDIDTATDAGTGTGTDTGTVCVSEHVRVCSSQLTARLCLPSFFNTSITM